jgi:competence protein ComGC
MREIFIILIIVIGVAIAIPNFHTTGHHTPLKWCRANQRVLMEAIEFYNMNNSMMMHTHVDQELLIRAKCLKTPVECPGERQFHMFPRSLFQRFTVLASGTYIADGDLALGGKVRCTIHGTPD